MAALVGTAACGSLFDYPVSEDEASLAKCTNGKDDDLDGKTDCDDSECAAHCAESDATSCTNGRDDDQDGKTDCDDSECAAHCAESGAALCANGKDDDADTLVDCDDDGCAGHCPERDAASCANGRDDDGDGLTDGRDPGCWSVLPLGVRRCSSRSAVTFVESLHHGSQGDLRQWATFGGQGYAVTPHAPEREGRQDPALRFPLPLDSPDPIATSLPGGLASRSTFALSTGFRLAFSARVDQRAWLRVEIVPAALAPPGEEPRAGAETALSLEIDGRASPRIAVLHAQGRKAVVALDGSGSDEWLQVALATRGDRVEADVGGEALAWDLSPGLAALPESRLVIRGGASGLVDTTGSVPFLRRWDAYLDDLVLVTAADEPCDAPVPTVPSAATCPGAPSGGDGATVSVARGAEWTCALAGGSATGSDATTRARAWRTKDGANWDGPAPGPTPPAMDAGAGAGTEEIVTFPERDGQRLAGAGVAWDGEQFVAVLAYGDAAGVDLESTRSTDCRSWSTPEPLLAERLPFDVEAPSRVVGGAFAPHEIWFTRPPTDETARTLWRLDSTDGLAWGQAPVPVAEWTAADQWVGAPVAIQRVGAEYVATYRISASSADQGLGVLVADPDAREWSRAAPFPVLGPSGATQAFDGSDLLAGALVWPPEGAWLVYGARPLSALGAREDARLGVAVVGPSGASLPTLGEGVPAPAPDGGTGDAAAPGDDVLFRMSFDDPLPAGPGHVVGATGALMLETVPFPGVTLAELPQSAIPLGDFELSFRVMAPEAGSTYTTFGLATEIGAFAAPGAYARVRTRCSGAPTADPSLQIEPFVMLPERSLAPDGCDHGVALPERWHRVALRRVGGVYSVHGLDDAGCALEGTALATVTPGVSLGELRWLTAWNEAGPILIDDVELRALTTGCDASGRRTCPGPSGSGSFCVDTESSPDHCGACGVACSASSTCVGGVCECEAGLDRCPAGCVNLRVDDGNCGACGVTCDPGEACVAGECFGSTSCNDAVVIDQSATLDPLLYTAGTSPCGSAYPSMAVLRFDAFFSRPVAVEVTSPTPIVPEVAVDLGSCTPSPAVMCGQLTSRNSRVVTFDARENTSAWIFVYMPGPLPAVVTIHEALSCDGSEVTFPAGVKHDCAPYACTGTSCRTTCMTASDCAAGATCFVQMGACG